MTLAIIFLIIIFLTQGSCAYLKTKEGLFLKRPGANCNSTSQRPPSSQVTKNAVHSARYCPLRWERVPLPALTSPGINLALLVGVSGGARLVLSAGDG